MDGTLIKVNNLDDNNQDIENSNLVNENNTESNLISNDENHDDLNQENTDLDSDESSTDQDDKSEDYDFLDENKKSVNDADIVSTQFDTAFKKSSSVIQNYILSDKFENNIKLICKIEKLDEDKAKIIIENITVSILVGLLPLSVAKDTMIESFRSSGILLESFTAGMIMKSIDTYILSDIRKQILESKVTSNREIRHLTLKEKKDEEAKEDLRRILLQRTGNISGVGQPLIQYQHRDLKEEKAKQEKLKQGETDKPVLNRETLLKKLGLADIDNTQKALDRMREIKNTETDRLKDEVSNNTTPGSENTEEVDTNLNLNNLHSEVSDNLANILQNKLNRKEDQDVNLDNLREKRGMEEAQNEEIKKVNSNFNLNPTIENYSKDNDPYRETIT